MNGVPIEALNDPEARDRMVLSIMGHRRCELKALDTATESRIWRCLDCGAEVPMKREF